MARKLRFFHDQVWHNTAVTLSQLFLSVTFTLLAAVGSEV